MKKKVMYMLVLMIALVLTWAPGAMSANAATVRTGTLGTNGGVQWSYDESTKTLTVTGEDSGLETARYASGNIYKICRDVEKIILQDFKPIGSVRNLFKGLSTLQTIEMNNVNTADVTDMSYMFYECSNLTALDVSGFDTSNVTYMCSMFDGCSSLTDLDVSGFDTSNVTDMNAMFYDCSSLIDLDVSGFDTSKATNMRRMFHSCTSLTGVDLSGFDTSKVTDMSSMFYICRSLTDLDLSGFDTSNVTSMGWMFYGCTSLNGLDLSGFDTSKVTDMAHMFTSCRSLTDLDVSSFNTSKVTDMSSMFYGCSGLTDLDVSGFNTSNVTDMNSMFMVCVKLTDLDLSGFDTSKVTDMHSMFSGCNKLTGVDISGFNTSKVTNMRDMFSGCIILAGLDVSGFDTSKVTDMDSMFIGCSQVPDLDVSGFDTSNVTNMSSMFSGCRSVTNLDLSGFDISNVTNLEKMLYNCSALNFLYTPVAMKENQVIALPVALTNARGEACSEITIDNHKMLLSKAGEKQDIKILADATELVVGDSLQLALKVDNAVQNISCNMYYDWSAVAQEVATVSATGLVTAVRAGSTTIQATVPGRSDLTAQLTVNVKDKVTLNTAEISDWTVGQEGNLTPYVNGKAVTADSMSWSSSNPKVATCVGGKLVGVGVGTTTISCTKENGTVATCEVTVFEKLEITGQPVNQSVEEGNSAVFKVTAKGDSLSYQWQQKAAGASSWTNSGATGATTASVTVAGKEANNGYQYRCVITDGRGNTVTSTAVTLTVLTKLAITSQPVSQSVEEGNSAVFKVTAKGDGLSYQWQQKAVGASTWTNSGATGATTASVTVAGKEANNGYQYRCVITDERGNTVTSNAATLTVLMELAITSQPVSQSVEEGNSAVFKVTAKGDNLSYQWQQKAAGASTWTNSGATGATTASVTVAGKEPNNGYQYRCVITDERGNTVTSNAVTLTVLMELAITGQPTSQSVTEGNKAVFKVTAKGNNLSYQWQVKTAGATKWTNSGMTGANTNSITVQGTKARNGYQYRCVITDASGDKVTSSAATLTVQTGVTITAQPESQSVAEGKNATFKVSVTGTGLTYQWQFRTSASGTWKNSGMTGAKTNSITVQGTAARNGYQYRCVITDENGNKVTSNGATLTVASKLAITGQPASQSVAEGANAVFKVTATGNKLTYQWQFRTSSAGTWKNSGMTGAKTNSITVQGTAARNGYQYRCVITDASGDKVTSNGATLTVAPKLAITGQPASQSVAEGANAVFKVTATGGKLSFQWQFRTSAAGTWKNSGMTGATTGSITVQGTAARNGYQYRCIITDETGNKVISNGATLTVAPKLAITSQPASQSVAEGVNAVFKVTATGSNLSYQWQFRTSSAGTWKNSGMTGATTGSITVQGTAARNGYQYRCIITEVSGNEVTSNGATLTVK